MLAVRYHRQLARSIYVWGVFTPQDFGTLIAGVALNIVLFDSTVTMAVILLGFPSYLVAFRLGRPPGNDFHFFQALLLPRQLRPGRAEFRPWRDCP